MPPNYEQIKKSWEAFAIGDGIKSDAEFYQLVRAYEMFVRLEEIFQPKSMSRLHLDTLQKCQRSRAEAARAAGAKFEPPGFA